MKPRPLTLAILGAVTLLLVSWDVWLALDGKPSNTISEAVLWLSGRSVAVPFLFGVLCGHIFVPMRSKK